MAAGGQYAIEEGQVGDAAVRGQVVEAARIDDQVVGAVKAGQREGVTPVEADVETGLARPVPRPGDGDGGEVDRVHLEATGREMESIAPRPTPQVERPPARGDHTPVEVAGQVLVRFRHEERDRP